MANKVKEFISQRRRDEWVRWLRDQWVDLRIWTQEHGELAFVSGVVLGSLLVIFPGVILGAILVLALCAVGIWWLAPTGVGVTASGDKGFTDAAGRPLNGHSGPADQDRTN